MPKPRILGGSARGRSLVTPKRGTRPSPSRLREGLFNILQARPSGRFLDLYAGSGAVGLEAASRGWQATLVDDSGAAVAAIRANAASLGLAVTVVRRDALAFLEDHGAAFDVIFAAPPYPLDLDAIFAAIAACGRLARGGLYAFQHPSLHHPELDPELPLERLRTRRYGSNAITLAEPRQNPTQA